MPADRDTSDFIGPSRIAIIDRCVPHYRRGLYDILMADRDRSFTIIAAARPVERIGTVEYPGPDGSGWRWIDAHGVRIAGSRGASVWQWGAVKAGLSSRYDAIIMMANPNDPSLWLCAMLARLTGKRLIFWTHGLTRRDRPLRRRLRVLWLRLAHAYAIYGHFGKIGMVSERLDPARCHVCYNALDYTQQASLRTTLTTEHSPEVRRDLFGSRSRAPIALSVSRLSAFKKVDQLVRAHASLQRAGFEANLLIIGDGAERPKLEALVDELGVRDSVRFVGECYDEQRLAAMILASDVSVTPGAIGLTVMHCLAYGVPCITHDDWFDHGPEFEAIIEGKTGGFFRKDDVDDLARVMKHWLSAPNRQAVATACIRTIERFYRPEIQAAVMLRALRGEAADDLWVAYQSQP